MRINLFCDKKHLPILLSNLGWVTQKNRINASASAKEFPNRQKTNKWCHRHRDCLFLNRTIFSSTYYPSTFSIWSSGLKRFLMYPRNSAHSTPPITVLSRGRGK